MPYCEHPKTCVCHGYRCCDPPVVPGQARVIRHCYSHSRGCHMRGCRKKPGRKPKRRSKS